MLKSRVNKKSRVGWEISAAPVPVHAYVNFPKPLKASLINRVFRQYGLEQLPSSGLVQEIVFDEPDDAKAAASAFAFSRITSFACFRMGDVWVGHMFCLTKNLTRQKFFVGPAVPSLTGTGWLQFSLGTPYVAFKKF